MYKVPQYQTDKQRKHRQCRQLEIIRRDHLTILEHENAAEEYPDCADRRPKFAFVPGMTAHVHHKERAARSKQPLSDSSQGHQQIDRHFGEFHLDFHKHFPQ